MIAWIIGTYLFIQTWIIGTYLFIQVYYITAYFVDTEVICNGGRTQAHFDKYGTGDRMIFQTGDTPDMRENIPLTQDGLISAVSFIEQLWVCDNIKKGYTNFAKAFKISFLTGRMESASLLFKHGQPFQQTGLWRRWTLYYHNTICPSGPTWHWSSNWGSISNVRWFG